MDGKKARTGLTAILLALGMLADGCARPAAPPPGDLPATAPEAAPAPDGGEDVGALRRAQDLAMTLYGALAAGNPRPLEERLDPSGTEVLVDTGQQGEEPYYTVVARAGEADWSALLAWAEAHPAEMIQEVTASTSPHDRSFILVTLRLPGGYAYFLVKDTRTVAKVFVQPYPAEWD